MGVSRQPMCVTRTLAVALKIIVVFLKYNSESAGM